jgi:hypothetical protein
MVSTFRALAELADFDSTTPIVLDEDSEVEDQASIDTVPTKQVAVKATPTSTTLVPLTMNIQIVIPSDATIEQYDKIFSSIKKFLTKQD